MTPTQFTAWLKGYFSNEPTSINEEHTKDHLAEVFNKVTPDRSEPEQIDENDYKDQILDWLKDPGLKNPENPEKWVCDKKPDAAKKVTIIRPADFRRRPGQNGRIC